MLGQWVVLALGAHMGEGGKKVLLLLWKCWAFGAIHFLSYLTLLFKEWLRGYQFVQRKGFTWCPIQTLWNAFVSTWTNLYTLKGLVATIYSSNNTFVSNSFCTSMLGSLIHLFKTMPYRGVLYSLLVFSPFNGSTLLDLFTWCSFEIIPTSTSAGWHGLFPVSAPTDPLFRTWADRLQPQKMCFVISCGEIHFSHIRDPLILTTGGQKAFPKRILFSLSTTGYIVLWTSVLPALQTHIITLVVMYNITSYRVAVMSTIEVAEMILLPKALKYWEFGTVLDSGFAK